jgi:RNase adaptor protein for sRNA GlmZ degradation
MRRVAQRAESFEEHFSINVISISFEEDQNTDVNMVEDNQSLPNQTHVTNTNKNNGRKGRPLKKNNIEGNNRETKDNNDNLDALENKDDNEVRAEVPIDEIKILKSHIEARDEELIR